MRESSRHHAAPSPLWFLIFMRARGHVFIFLKHLKFVKHTYMHRDLISGWRRTHQQAVYVMCVIFKSAGGSCVISKKHHRERARERGCCLLAEAAPFFLVVECSARSSAGGCTSSRLLCASACRLLAGCVPPTRRRLILCEWCTHPSVRRVAHTAPPPPLLFHPPKCFSSALSLSLRASGRERGKRSSRRHIKMPQPHGRKNILVLWLSVWMRASEADLQLWNCWWIL